jgi:hypothetical protein
VDKIVIVINRPEPDRGLLTYLNTLFPDSEIHIVFKEVGTFEKRPAGGRPAIYSECVHTGNHDQRSA